MEASIRQKKVYDEWKNTDNNILIQAVAGSGKTTTLLHLMDITDGNILHLAFNKSIQLETEEKIKGLSNKRIITKTMHALGYQSLQQIYKSIKVNENKKYEIFKIIRKHFEFDFKYVPYKNVLSLLFFIDKCNNYSRMYLTDDMDEMIVIMKDNGIDINIPLLLDKVTISNITEKAIKEQREEDIDKDILEANYKKFIEVWNFMLELRYNNYKNHKFIEIDFLDMIFLPIYLDLKFNLIIDYLFLDEVQDFNLCQHRLIDMLLEQNNIKKFIAVGDKYQAIYGFAGAYDESFDLFLSKKGNTIELPLDINYRCASDIVKHSNENTYDIMTAFKTNRGLVKSFAYDNDEDNDTTIKELLEVCKMINQTKETGGIICRNLKPLVVLYFYLIKNHINCYIKGDDITELVKNYLSKYNFGTIEELLDGLDNDYNEYLKKLPDDEKLKAGKMKEDIDIIKIFINNLKIGYNEKVSVLQERIKDIINIRKEAIVMSSIHKAKGLEYNNVIFLNSNLIPSKYAVTPRQIKQENNLRYVAITRAKERLYYFNIIV